MLFWSFSSSLVKIILRLPWDWEIRDRTQQQLGEMYCKAILYLAEWVILCIMVVDTFVNMPRQNIHDCMVVCNVQQVVAMVTG